MTNPKMTADLAILILNSLLVHQELKSEAETYTTFIINKFDRNEVINLIKQMQTENAEQKKVIDATFLYMKYINSPLCIGWDNLLDAMQGWRKYLGERK